MALRSDTPRIRFDTTPYVLMSSTILRLPADASKSLPSRGQVAVRGTLGGHEFQTVLEPDGDAGHWMKVDKQLQKAAAVKPGNTVALDIQTVKAWPEPELPKDLGAALADAPTAIRGIWHEITPMARWEWVRWVNATKNPDTRQRRVEVTISKLQAGKRRPCCFDLSACTDPDLAKNGKLIVEG